MRSGALVTQAETSNNTASGIERSTEERFKTWNHPLESQSQRLRVSDFQSHGISDLPSFGVADSPTRSQLVNSQGSR